MDQDIQANDKKHIMFDWFAKNGGLFEGFDVPVKFPGGEIGAAANRDLPQRTAIMSIPGKCIITVRKALESELKPIFAKHAQLFSDEHTSDLWSDVMALYLLFELLKKENSFFYPFLEWLPKSDFTLVDWPMEKVKEFHSPLLEENTILLGEKLKKRYQTMKSEIIDKEEVFLQFNAS